MAHYELDQKNYAFRRASRTVWSVVRGVLVFLFVSLSLSALYYVVFALVYDTDVEKGLRRENRVYAKVIPDMRGRLDLLEDDIDYLQDRDNKIYEAIFHAPAPSVDPLGEVVLPSGDSLSAGGRGLVMRTAAKTCAVEKTAQGVEEAFAKVFAELASKKTPLPPMMLPLEDFEYPRTGASVGQKVSPLFKVAVQHNGIDLVANQGAPVLATADGVVSDVRNAFKGQGNTIEIDHGNGFKTRYAHLDEISVSKGQRVKRGARIATVGSSGSTFTPHLHYEVVRDGTFLDPSDCFFGSLDADGYARLKYMSATTGQSLD